MIATMWNEGGPSGLGYSEVEAYLRCPKEYQLGKVRGMSRPISQTPDYFAIGSFLHAGRARWFAEGMGLGDEVWQKMIADVDNTRSGFPLPTSEEAYSTALRYLQEYVEHWSIREKPKIVAVEHMLGPVRIDTRMEDGIAGTERTARLDDFGFYPEAGDKLMIGECKTTAGNIADVANQYTMHGQPGLQQLLWKLAPQGEAMYGAVSGMILDVIQKGMGGKRCQFARLAVDVPERLMVIVRNELAKALVRKERVTWNSDEERRVTSCTRLIGKARVACAFRDVCLYGRAGTMGMTFEDGSPVPNWQASEGKEVPPWD
jgi:PD-(D/E)XK nuclease superfamily